MLVGRVKSISVQSSMTVLIITELKKQLNNNNKTRQDLK